MGKFIIGTFVILAWAFYAMSGGASFEPETRLAKAPPPASEASAPVEVPVTTLAAPVPVPTPPVPAPEAELVEAATQVAATFDGATAEVTGITPEFTSLAAPAPADVASPDLGSLRLVDARAVNMRAGPDTSFDVLDTLPRGTQTEVVENDGNGWVRVRVINTGQMGWMAERLLTPS
ncbi:SH3 domain-containing protein [Loktanella sp. R86503]|uniref:SH3 domain-containing protein n=1 Tax=Loktanella sp. R86503 TaxID=3093847 RepID=UPI0036DD782F